MTQVSAAMVKQLRDKTGAGMMDCKKALTETEGDIDGAVDWLRTKGLAAAQKKAGRVAAEGLVAVAVDGTKGAVVEINAETDFVARNDKFQNFVKTVAGLAVQTGGDLESLSNAAYPDTGRTVTEELTQLIASIGENMSLRRVHALSVDQGVVAQYIHNQTGPGIGRIGVLVAVESSGDTAQLETFGRQVAMHIAASTPQSVDVGSLDPASVERERQVLAEQARESGKPENIIEKMVEGRLRKFYQDVVLTEQVWVHDGESRVSDAVKAQEKALGAPVKIKGFERYSLGEGIEKQESDFAAEVMAQASS